jgi:hypothetical protein
MGGKVISDFFRIQFPKIWELETQQKNARLIGAAKVEPGWTAKEFTYLELDAVDAVETTGQRFGDTNPQEIAGLGRKGYQRQIDIAIVRDQWDDTWLDTQAVPNSDLVVSMSAARNRKIDDFWIDAVASDVLGGTDANNFNDPLPLPNSSKIAVNHPKPGQAPGANTGLTPWKIWEAMTRFKEGDVDTSMEELYLMIAPRHINSLFLAADAAPNDEFAKIVLHWYSNWQDGKMTKLFGFNVLESNRVKRSGGIAQCAAFAKSAFRASNPVSRLKMDVLAHKRHALQIAEYTTFGVFRVNDKKVQQIFVQE